MALIGAVCMACGKEWKHAMPKGFIYQDVAGGWHPVHTNGWLHGYCPPCAQQVADADHQEHVNGNWERRTIEDERWVWAC